RAWSIISVVSPNCELWKTCTSTSPFVAVSTSVLNFSSPWPIGSSGASTVPSRRVVAAKAELLMPRPTATARQSPSALTVEFICTSQWQDQRICYFSCIGNLDGRPKRCQPDSGSSPGHGWADRKRGQGAGVPSLSFEVFSREHERARLGESPCWDP